MITPSFGLTATERVLPKLALDFTTASLDSRVTFTRTTDATHPATYVNSSGVVTAATNNQPRFDHDPVTLACKGLLIEESRTNLDAYSDDFNNTAWFYNNIGVTANSTTSPDGTTNADTVVQNSAASQHAIYKLGVSVTSGTTYTQSFYVKSNGTTQWIQLAASTGFDTTKYMNFDIVNGVVGNSNGVTSYAITPAGNNWFRCSISIPATATGTGVIVLGLLQGNTASRLPSYTGDGTSGIYVWGAQLEAGAFATSYIPTTTAALTRNADVAVMTGTNFSDWFNASEGTLLAEATGQSTYLQIGVGANTNSRIWISPFTGQNFVYGDAAGTNQCALGSSSLAGLLGKICGAYKLNNFGCAISGAATTTDLSGTVGATPDSLAIGYRNTTSPNAFLNGTIKKFMYWSQRLTNAELQAFSK